MDARGESSFVTREDRSLAESLGRGESEAISRVRRWIRAAVTPFRRRLGTELEDLEQEVLVSLTETLRRGGFEGRSRLATYVKKAAVYRCLNRIRDARKRTFVSPEDVRLRSKGPDPYRMTADRDEAEKALRVLARMSDHCLELWKMIRDGMTYREMSDRLGVAPGALRVRMLRCRRRAHELWERSTGSPR